MSAHGPCRGRGVAKNDTDWRVTVPDPFTISGMALESIFSLAGMAAMAGWLLLILLPRVRIAQQIAGIALPLLLAGTYLALIAIHAPGAPGGFGSLAQVASLFSRPELLLAGWIHYLAFDLFIGGWETRDATRHGVPHLLVIPCLLLTFMLGPIGLLAYFALRTWRTRGLEIATS